MFGKEFNISLALSFLIASLCFFALFMAQSANSFEWSNIALSLESWESGTCLSLGYLFAYLGIASLMARIEFDSVNQLFGYLILGGLCGFSLLLIFYEAKNSLFALIGLDQTHDTVSAFFEKLIVTISFFLFSLSSILSIKKLVFINRIRSEIAFWNVFEVFLLILLFRSSLNLNIPALDPCLLGFGTLIMAWLISKVRWVALLNQKKILTLFFLLCIIGLFVSFLNVFSNTFILKENQDVFVLIDKFYLIFPTYITISAFTYVCFSFLAILFNMPISNVIEQKEHDIKGFKELSSLMGQEITGDSLFQSKKRQNWQNALFERLFDLCLKNTGADGGFLYIEDNSGKYKGGPFYKGVNENKISDILALFKQDILRLEELYEAKLKQDHRKSKMPFQFESLYAHSLEFKSAPSKEKGRFAEDKKQLGYLFLFKKYSNGFDQYMLRLLRAYIKQALIAIHNAERLDYVIESDRLRNEMKIAQKIQNKLIPELTKEMGHLKVSTYYQPASEVGGDYFDCIYKAPNKQLFVIADVSGKGINAAFHVAKMKGIFQSLTAMDLDLEKILNHCNNSVKACFEKGVFISLIILDFDQKKRTLNWARAGHCPILFWDDAKQKLTELEGPGIGLGIINEVLFKKSSKVQSKQYQENDFFVLYTDGVIEARNNKKEEFGLQRLKNSLIKNKDKNVEILKMGLIEDLNNFRKDETIFDDLSVIIIKSE